MLLHLPVGLWFKEAMGRTTSYIFQNKNNFSISLNRIIHFCDIRMIKSLHKLYFTSNWFLSLQVFHLVLQINFESYSFVHFFVHAYVHSCVSSLSNLASKDIVLCWVIIREDNYFLFLFLFLCFLLGLWYFQHFFLRLLDFVRSLFFIVISYFVSLYIIAIRFLLATLILLTGCFFWSLVSILDWVQPFFNLVEVIRIS